MKTHKIIMANWKMAVDRAAVQMLAENTLVTCQKYAGQVDVTLCAPYIYLHYLASIVSNKVSFGAQDVAVPEHPKGSQTGDISPAMLRDVGCDYVIIGHSERRARYGETNALIHAKLLAAHAAGLIPILCVEERPDDRTAGRDRAHEVVRAQMIAALAHYNGPLILAYEPSWAIGGKVSATLDDIADMHHFIHRVVADSLAHLGEIRMVYGGSVNPDNAAGILALPYVDGALVGGASLDPQLFSGVIEAGANARNYSESI